MVSLRGVGVVQIPVEVVAVPQAVELFGGEEVEQFRVVIVALLVGGDVVDISHQLGWHDVHVYPVLIREEHLHQSSGVSHDGSVLVLDGLCLPFAGALQAGALASSSA